MAGLLKADKRAMRGALSQRRAGLSVDARVAWSAALTGHLLIARRWRDATAVAAFVGVGNEPDMTPILLAALADGKQLWLPRVISQTELDFALVTDLNALLPAPFGLREPAAEVEGCTLAEAGVQLVLVPGLAFGSDGARIGFGRGYYDRALGGLGRPRPVAVGLGFSAFVDPPEGRIPMGPHDVRVDFLLTERGLLPCLA